MQQEQDQVKALQEQLERALAERYRMGHGIRRDGKEIVVPPHMGLEDASEAIMSFVTEMEEVEDTRIELKTHPYDAAYAFFRSVKEIYGSLTSDKNMSFFGPMPGRTYVIPLDYDESIQIPVGAAKVPGLPIKMNIHVAPVDGPEAWSEGEPGCIVVFTCKKKYTPLVKDIEETAQRYLRESSIFTGKALDTGYEFLNVKQFNPSQVVYTESQHRQLDANIFTVIKETERSIAANIPIKRGILLHGPYGTGKTLTALVTAKMCVDNGWTFVMVRHGDNIERAIRMAQRYEPACVFFEDIDAAAGEERDADVNGILNSIDGMLSKDSKVMVVLTTNHLEKINPAMLRPGRLDAVIMLGAYDQDATIRFIRQIAVDTSGVSMLKGDLDAKALYEASQGYVPAFLKEAVSKATLYAIARGEEGDVKLTSDDILAALLELRPQYDMMMRKRTVPRKTIDDMVDDKIAEAV